MKRLILSAAMFLFFAGIASAQTSTGGSGSRTTRAVSSTGSQNSSTKKGSKAKKDTITSGQGNQRREYKGKDGQTATPTGHEATGVGATNAAAGTDTTRKKSNQQ